MKKYYEMEERVRSLATERQKLYNEMYKMRSELDESELTVKEKEEHIDSLKSVMRGLEEQIMDRSVEMEEKDSGSINRAYNAECLGN